MIKLKLNICRHTNNPQFLELEKFKFVGATLIPHITKITTQRQSVWENLYALIFYQKMEENTWKKQM